MKQVICDTCGVHADPDEYGMAPVGWLRVDLRDRRFSPSKDFCSKSCAVQALTPPPVSEVERVIEDAERAGLSAASLV
jgi:ferredoxin